MRQGYVTFTGYHAPSTNRTPSITIQQRGVISINRAAYDLLQRPEWVRLGYRAEDHSIEIRACAPGEEGATLVRKQPHTSAHYVAGLAFTHWHGIDTTVARAYTPTLEDGAFYLDLAKGRVVTGPQRLTRKATEVSEAAGSAMEEVREVLAHLESQGKGLGVEASRPEIRQLLKQLLQMLEEEPAQRAKG